MAAVDNFAILSWHFDEKHKYAGKTESNSQELQAIINF